MNLGIDFIDKKVAKIIKKYNLKGLLGLIFKIDQPNIHLIFNELTSCSIRMLEEIKLDYNKLTKEEQEEIKKIGKIFYINKNKKEIGIIFNNRYEIVLMEY